jgi:hypothetical protein
MQKKTKAYVIRQIQETGYLREVDTTQLRNAPELTVENDPSHSMAFGWGGGTGIIIYLYIKADRPIRIVEFGDLELAGQELNVKWFMSEEPRDYRFHGAGGPWYARDAVLNHRLGKRGLVQPGDPVEGVLLGYCSRSLSSNGGFRLPMALSIADGFGTLHRAELLVPFDKSTVTFARRQGSLFGPARHGLHNSYHENKSHIANEPLRDASEPCATRIDEDSDLRR